MQLNTEERERLIQQITRFVSNNDLLEKLNAKLNEFNPFEVLKVTHHEIRHSNVLSWLLHPKESHFMGDYFLKKIISEVLCGDVVRKNHSLQITDILVNDFHDAEVFREWRNIDLVIISKKNSFVLFIENKVHAGLASHQLEKYLETIKQTFPTMKHIVPVFLTLNSDEAPHDEYYSLSHSQILNILKLALEMYKDRMSNKIYDFIYYYIRTLEDLTMQDEQLIALCSEIYKQHKEAIDAIVKYGMVLNSSLHQAVEKLKENNNLDIIDSTQDNRFFKNDKELWFIPTFLAKSLPSLIRKWRSPFPVAYFFVREEKKLRLILEVGPIQDGQIRLQLLNEIVKHNSQLFSAKSSALTNVNGTFTRIRHLSIGITDWNDIDYLSERINDFLVNDFKYDEVNKVLMDILQNYDSSKIGQQI